MAIELNFDEIYRSKYIWEEDFLDLERTILFFLLPRFLKTFFDMLLKEIPPLTFLILSFALL